MESTNCDQRGGHQAEQLGREWVKDWCPCPIWLLPRSDHTNNIFLILKRGSK